MSMGNRTGPRGHRPRLGGKKSKGTVRLSLKVPVETYRRMQKKIGKNALFSEYMRRLIEADLKRG